MKLELTININQSKEVIWKAITDIENCSDMISSIVALEIIDKPETGLVGLKWKETREMFGKEAVETMWITEAVENEYYIARAESHGSVYVSKLALKDLDGKTQLSMSFEAIAQTTLAKIMSFCMGFLIIGSMKKMVNKDLQDIKKFCEAKNK
jgi:hypothetical protein